jgi:hypothetical protein
LPSRTFGKIVFSHSWRWPSPGTEHKTTFLISKSKTNVYARKIV